MSIELVCSYTVCFSNDVIEIGGGRLIGFSSFTRGNKMITTDQINNVNRTLSVEIFNNSYLNS